jgi:hypothetical protein
MFFDDDDEVDNGPVANNGKEGLKCVLEEGGGTAADCDRGHETKGNKGNSWDTNSLRSEVLSVQCK